MLVKFGIIGEDENNVELKDVVSEVVENNLNKMIVDSNDLNLTEDEILDEANNEKIEEININDISDSDWEYKEDEPNRNENEISQILSEDEGNSVDSEEDDEANGDSNLNESMNLKNRSKKPHEYHCSQLVPVLNISKQIVKLYLNENDK